MLLSHAPFVPIVAADTRPSAMQIGEQDDFEIIDIATSPVPIPQNGQMVGLSKEAVHWGLGGVVFGSVLSGAITALAFGSYRRRDSVVGPFLWSTLGSMAIGGTLLLVLNRAVGGKIDNRWLAATMGAKLAT